MNRSTLLHCFFSFALCVSSFCGARAESYYVDPAHGNDTGKGTQAEPFKTVARAIELTDGKGGEIHLSPNAGPYREPIIFRKGGLPSCPLILDGHGAVVNLGVDVTKGPWSKTDDGGYVLEGTAKLNTNPQTGQMALGSYGSTPVFVNGLGLFCDHPMGKGQPAWHGGKTRLDAQGRLVIVFPQGLTPENSVVVLTGGPQFTSCGVQCLSASNVVIRNLTSAFSADDGFNFHGICLNVVLERCKGIFNADQGISSHDDCQVDVRDSEVAFNGTQGGGVTDVTGRCFTNYKNMRMHQNRGSAFQLQGKYHVLEGIVSYGNGHSNIPKPVENIEMHDMQDLGTLPSEKIVPVFSAAVPPPAQPEEADRLGRFLQVRPPTQ